ncbi:SDR family oxidoreductase [Sphingomonas sp. UYP23]
MITLETETGYHWLWHRVINEIQITVSTIWSRAMLIVTGANGQLGRAIVNSLVQFVPAERVGVSVRDPSKARDLVALGVRVRVGNFDDGESLNHAFEGASRVLLVSSNAAATGGDPLAQHRTAIEAARRSGAKRIFYTSHAAADESSAFPPARDHAATETMLSQVGVPWTSLRHGFYAESALMFMGDWQKTGTVSAPADGKVAWTAHEDLAEADARLLCSEQEHDGPTAALTGSAALDLADLAGMISNLTGRTVHRVVIPDSEIAERMASRGAPPSATAIALGLYHASRQGEFATVDPALELLLGRKPKGMSRVLAEGISRSTG